MANCIWLHRGLSDPIRRVFRPTDQASVIIGIRNLSDRDHELAEGFPKSGRGVYLTTRLTFCRSAAASKKPATMLSRAFVWWGAVDQPSAIASTEIDTSTSSETAGANAPRLKSLRSRVVVASKPNHGLFSIG